MKPIQKCAFRKKKRKDLELANGGISSFDLISKNIYSLVLKHHCSTKEHNIVGIFILAPMV
jgi:hypothetical protein